MINIKLEQYSAVFKLAWPDPSKVNYGDYLSQQISVCLQNDIKSSSYMSSKVTESAIVQGKGFDGSNLEIAKQLIKYISDNLEKFPRVFDKHVLNIIPITNHSKETIHFIKYFIKICNYYHNGKPITKLLDQEKFLKMYNAYRKDKKEKQPDWGSPGRALDKLLTGKKHNNDSGPDLSQYGIEIKSASFKNYIKLLSISGLNYDQTYTEYFFPLFSIGNKLGRILIVQFRIDRYDNELYIDWISLFDLDCTLKENYSLSSPVGGPVTTLENLLKNDFEKIDNDWNMYRGRSKYEGVKYFRINTKGGKYFVLEVDPKFFNWLKTNAQEYVTNF